MNKQKAQAIIQEQDHQLNFSQRMNTQTAAQEYAYLEAKGYLEAIKKAKVLEASLKRCGTFAGHPDPKEGCRQICNEVKTVLAQWEKEK